MEDFWRLAQQPALRVWRPEPSGGGGACEANAAALQWALGQGLDAVGLTPRWQWLATQLLREPDGPWLLGPDGPALSGQRIAVADGALLWWSAAPTLAAALQAAGVTVWRIDPSGRTLSFDPDTAVPASIGRGLRSVALDAIRERVHVDDRELVTRATEEALRGEQAVDVVARYLQQDHSWKPMLTRRISQRDAGGRSLGLLGISLDISLLVVERDDMLRQRERLSTVAEAVGLGLWSREGPDGATEWNEPMYRIHHRQPGEGPPDRAQWLERHVHPLDRPRVRQEQEEADRLWPPIQQTEFRIPTPEGGVRWVYSWTRREQRNGRRTAFGLHLDVTDRRDAEFELQQERERALFSLGAAGVGVWRRIDAEHAFWSEAMYRLRGLEPDDPRPPSELQRLTMHPDDWAQSETLVERVRRDGQPYEWEFRVLWPDGTQRWLVTRGKAVQDAAGQTLYMAGVNVDVTERHHAQALAQEGQRLEQLKRTQSEFLARVSHELRTPMNAVLGFTQLLHYDQREPLTARQSERVARIDAAGRHLLALIDDVLDLARIDVDQQPLADEPVTLDDLAREAMDWVAGMAAEAGVELRLQGGYLDGRVRADRRRLGQVAVNLLTNAIKYNRRGGFVEVGTRVRGADETEQWALVVRDSGRGLRPEQAKRIFEPFNRLGAELEGIAGTGIGLAIVRQLSERMRGRVEVDSEPGVGSEFRVWLPGDNEATRPVELDELPLRSLDGRRPEDGGERLRVLCVEDNPVNLLLVTELLALRPVIELHSAITGRAGIAEALLRRPDVLLLDLQLPDMHGSEVLAALRSRPQLAHCRFIALSANAMPGDVQTAMAQGFDDYWTKPIDVGRFLANIDALISSSSLGGG